jgi:Cyclin, N-terminal domain/Cyclin, C-terminal domain
LSKIDKNNNHTKSPI